MKHGLSRASAWLPWALLLFLGLVSVRAWVVGAGGASPCVIEAMGLGKDLLSGKENGRQGLVMSLWHPTLPVLVASPLSLLPKGPMRMVLGHGIGLVAGLLILRTVFSAARLSGSGRIVASLLCFVCLSHPHFLASGLSGELSLLGYALLASAVLQFSLWRGNRRTGHLVSLSIRLSLAQLAAPLAVPFVVFFGLCVLGALLREKGRPKGKVEGAMVLFAMPILYGLSLWLLFGWLIMGDPFCAWRNALGGASAAGPEKDSLVLDAAAYAWGLLARHPLFVACLVLGICWPGTRRVALWAGLLVLFWRAGLFLLGAAWGDASDAMLLVVFACLWLGSAVPRRAGQILLAAAAVLGLFRMGRLAEEPRRVLGEANVALRDGKDILGRARELESVGEAVERAGEDGWILVTGYAGYQISEATGSARLIHDMTFQLKKTLSDTSGKPLYLLLPRPEGEAAASGIYSDYPTLYEKGAPFLLFEEGWENWRLWRVVRSSANPWNVTVPLEFRTLGE